MGGKGYSELENGRPSETVFPWVLSMSRRYRPSHALRDGRPSERSERSS
jgi:hypothetical protein